MSDYASSLNDDTQRQRSYGAPSASTDHTGNLRSCRSITTAKEKSTQHPSHSFNLRTALADLDDKTEVLTASSTKVNQPFLSTFDSPRENTSRNLLLDLSSLKLPICGVYDQANRHNSHKDESKPPNTSHLSKSEYPELAIDNADRTTDCPLPSTNFVRSLNPLRTRDLELQADCDSHSEAHGQHVEQDVRRWCTRPNSEIRTRRTSVDSVALLGLTATIEGLVASPEKRSQISPLPHGGPPMDSLISGESQQKSSTAFTTLLDCFVENQAEKMWKQPQTISDSREGICQGSIERNVQLVNGEDGMPSGPNKSGLTADSPGATTKLLPNDNESRDLFDGHDHKSYPGFVEGTSSAKASNLPGLSTEVISGNPAKCYQSHASRMSSAFEDLPEIHLMRDMQDLRSENSRLSFKCGDYLNTIQVCKRECKDLQEQLNNLESHLTFVNRNYQEAQMRVEEQKNKVESLGRAYKSVQNSFSACVKEQNVLKERFGSFSGQIAELKIEIMTYHENTRSTLDSARNQQEIKHCALRIFQSSEAVSASEQSLKDELRNISGPGLSHLASSREELSRSLDEVKSLARVHKDQLELRLTRLASHFDASLERMQHSHHELGSQAGRYLSEFSRTLQSCKAGILNRLVEASNRILGLRMTLLLQSQTLNDVRMQARSQDCEIQCLREELSVIAVERHKQDQEVSNTTRVLTKIKAQLVELKCTILPITIIEDTVSVLYYTLQTILKLIF